MKLKVIMSAYLILLTTNSLKAGENFDKAINYYQNKNYEKAVELFRDLCYQRIPDNVQVGGCKMLGEMYESGFGNLPKDHMLAFIYYKKACSMTDYLCGDLGKAYYLGIGVQPDASLAVTYFQKSCAAGNQAACDILK